MQYVCRVIAITSPEICTPEGSYLHVLGHESGCGPQKMSSLQKDKLLLYRLTCQSLTRPAPLSYKRSLSCALLHNSRYLSTPSGIFSTLTSANFPSVQGRSANPRLPTDRPHFLFSTLARCHHHRAAPARLLTRSACPIPVLPVKVGVRRKYTASQSDLAKPCVMAKQKQFPYARTAMKNPSAKAWLNTAVSCAQPRLYAAAYLAL